MFGLKFIKRIITYPKRKLAPYYMVLLKYMDGKKGQRLRYKYYKKRLKYCGKNVIFDTGVTIENPQYISIGDGTHIDKNCILVASSPDLDLSYRYVKTRKNDNYKFNPGEIFIGKDCHISQNAMIYGYGGVYIGDNAVMSADAKLYSLTSIPYNPYNRAEIVSIVPYTGKSPTLMGPVVLEDNAWCGIGCIISPGITFGKNSFAKSFSVINDSFEENSYIGGIPAKLIRSRYEDYKKIKQLTKEVFENSSPKTQDGFVDIGSCAFISDGGGILKTWLFLYYLSIFTYYTTKNIYDFQVIINKTCHFIICYPKSYRRY